MSKSIHTIYRDLKGLSKKELEEQQNDPDSELTELAKKYALNKEVKSKRKTNFKTNREYL